ncbi:yrdC domain-containing protein, mitochondrial [Pipistrellus kuhlii]|uniref:Threonylcarbamoyl-AMP synthase n=2 Tax=Pipistrellus kuhlii TaxID=59472 RepID=A0A7J8ADR2_PIPKU|nr:yrdC domain-containing protein, mitochondrial [Pipistrellus kuhlii]KAF6384190.1 yrdC N6-threonylcarbamoyltransferase domain containing [Pipistrellus kuhlii]
MSPAHPCWGLRAAVAASVGLSEGPVGSARKGRLLRPPGPARATPGARLLRLPGNGAVRAASPERAGWAEALRAAVAELRSGAVVAVPTDTLYGLACSASCSAALDAVYRLKGRSEAKPLAVCLGRVVDVYRYCHVRVPEGLLNDLLPGPVTLVMERSEELNKDLNPFTPLVGIRIPDHAFMQDLAQMFGGPLALTSANLSSQPSSLNVKEFQDLWPQLSLVIDGGPIGDGKSPRCRLGSTVVDLSVPGKFDIIRAGCALENTTAVLQGKYGLLPHRDPAETWAAKGPQD